MIILTEWCKVSYWNNGNLETCWTEPWEFMGTLKLICAFGKYSVILFCKHRHWKLSYVS